MIVVDDGSPQSLDEVVQPFRDRLHLTLIRKPNGGPASARNAGAAVARGRFLTFTDDDCRPAPDWLRKLEARCEETPDHMIGGRTVNRLARNPYAIAGGIIIDTVYEHYNERPEPVGFFTSNNMTLSTERFRQIGGFDAEFFTAASEDREICDRWLTLGYKMIYAREIVVYHVHLLRFRSFSIQQFTYGRGAMRYHQLRALRGTGRLSRDLQFYLRLARRLWNPVPGRGRGLAIGVGGALALSQVVYAAGFLYETYRYRRCPGLTADPARLCGAKTR